MRGCYVWHDVWLHGVCTGTAQGAEWIQLLLQTTDFPILGLEATILPPPISWFRAGIFLLLYNLTHWPFPESR